LFSFAYFSFSKEKQNTCPYNKEYEHSKNIFLAMFSFAYFSFLKEK